MSTRPKPDANFVNEQSVRMIELIQSRSNLSREDLEYVVTHAAAMKDERLKSCIAQLIGWGDEERAEIETFVAIAIQIMKKTTLTRIREAAQIVEIRHLVKPL